MKIGPLTQSDFSKLKQMLEEHQIKFEVSLDEAVKSDPKLAIPAERLTPYPTYLGEVPFIYLDMPAAGILLVKSELEKFVPHALSL